MVRTMTIGRKQNQIHLKILIYLKYEIRIKTFSTLFAL